MPFNYDWIPPEEKILAELDDTDLLGYIVNSSAYHKGIVTLPEKFNSLREDYIKFYVQCRTYATNSIVASLSPLPRSENCELFCDNEKQQFRILARVGTNYDEKTIEETAKKRLYQSFSILENCNLSHFPGEVLYGYYTGVIPEMIGYIFPMDANTWPGALNRLELSESSAPEILLDMPDLIIKARRHGSYCQVSVFTRCRRASGEVVPLYPDCVIAIDELNSATIAASVAHKIPILTIHSGKNTLNRVADDCSAAHHFIDWVLPLSPVEQRYAAYDDFYVPDYIN